MNKTLLTLFFGLAMTATLSAAERTFNYNGKLYAINSHTAADVTYIPSTGSAIKITVTGPDENIGNLKVEYLHGTLTFKTDKKTSRNPLKGVTVTVTGPVASKFNATSAGDIICDTPFKVYDLTVKTSSAGDIKLRSVKAATATFSSLSAGDITVNSAECEDVTITCSSAGDIHFKDLTATTADISANSSGDITISHIKAGSLSARANSSGDITIAGKAVNAYLSAISAGNIRVAGLKANNKKISNSNMGKVHD